MKLTMTDWTPDDMSTADREGWNLFTAHGSVHGSPQLQRDDEAEKFTSDAKAGDYVVARARGGSILHQKALAILENDTPTEYEAVLRLKTQLTTDR